MRYRTEIKTLDGSIKVIGSYRDGKEDTKAVMDTIRHQQQRTSRKTGMPYMPQGEILSCKVVSDGSAVVIKDESGRSWTPEELSRVNP